MSFKKRVFHWFGGSILLGFVIGIPLTIWHLNTNHYLELGLTNLAFLSCREIINLSISWLVLICTLLAFIPLSIKIAVSGRPVLARLRLTALYYSALLCGALCLVTGFLANVYLLPLRYDPISLAADAVIIIFFLTAALILWKKKIVPEPSLNISLPSSTRILCYCMIAGWSLLNMVAPLVNRSVSVPRPYNVVIMLVDALRADHLGCYGYRKPTSPFLDQWSQEVLLFKNCYSQESYTMASVASLFTSTYPNEHQVLYDYPTLNYLDNSFLTMAEILKNYNYLTAAIAFNPHLRPKYNFKQGFDNYYWEELIPGLGEKPMHEVYETAHKIEIKVRKFLKKSKPSRPFFLYLHYRDVHGPFVPPPPYHLLFLPPNIEPRVDILYQKEYPFKKIIAPTLENSELIVSQYDGEIIYTDEKLKSLIQLFYEYEINNSNTIFIFIADHGKEFVDLHPDGKLFIGEHGRTLYREQLHVPLICSFPNYGSPGQVVDQRVKLIDILPSVLEALGIHQDEFSFRGSSFLPFLEKEEKLRSVYSGGNHGRYSLIDDHWKYYRKWRRESLTGFITRPAPGEIVNYENELYDISADPLETVNLARFFPDTVAELALKAENLFSHHPDSNLPSEQNTRKIGRELEEQLRSLGYIK